ncbi:hypothetical protein V6N11_071691 [Hibiscus sabdariffa]|uniref:Uncharacterized protein n=1 Tax=Hibiscus sabdariffa TaxID=183260 RepID=A0ABR2U0V3_9ROSI
MSEGTLVGAHVIKMMGYIQTLEKQGFALNNELVTDVILQSFSDSFKQFILNFNMNDIDKTLPQLLGMLRTAKSNLKKNGSNSIQIVRIAKERERKGQSLRVMESPNPKECIEIQKEELVKKEKCFHNYKPGHLKRNCPCLS